MIKRTIQYIEQKPWDDRFIERDERRMKAVCWIMIFIAVVYFAGVFVGMAVR